VDDLDVYFEEYWQDKTVFEAERRYLEATLDCVRLHEDFDVLAHLTYIAKTTAHHGPRPVPYAEHRELIDEILKTVAAKGKGLEINTSGVDLIGATLPDSEYLRRFKELGGEIITVGSDAHQTRRVGQYTDKACAMAKEIFGHVCTFEKRQPIFNRL
jgi:histidinol-phosphatase (PHP family)